MVISHLYGSASPWSGFPGFKHSTNPPNGSGVLRPEFQTPEADGFVGNYYATFGHQVLNIAKTQRESVI